MYAEMLTVEFDDNSVLKLNLFKSIDQLSMYDFQMTQTNIIASIYQNLVKIGSFFVLDLRLGSRAQN